MQKYFSFFEGGGVNRVFLKLHISFVYYDNENSDKEFRLKFCDLIEKFSIKSQTLVGAQKSP